MYKVVLVDDEQRITGGLKRIIPWAEYNCMLVGIANDAKAGRELIMDIKPHILFTDICMPGEDGLMMLAGFRLQFPDMKVIVLSGHGDFDYTQRAIKLGVFRYLLKPSKINEIQECLVEAVSQLDKIAENTSNKTAIEVNDDEEQAIKTNGAAGFIVNKAYEYMEIHYADKLTLQALAEDCYVSQWYLSKLLNKKLGKNFYTLLNEIRIEKAKEYLAVPSLSINKICVLIGYTETTHFSRVFKSVTGKSASKYRNEIFSFEK